MNEHLNDFNKMITDLKNLDLEIDDEDKALLLLNSLPDIYEHLITILLYGKEKIKFIDGSNALVNNEYWKKDQIIHKESKLEALTVRGKRHEDRKLMFLGWTYSYWYSSCLQKHKR
jgi:cell division cycle protein 20 (cofactor of APC complex)